MRVLGLDCATRTGWALLENGEPIETGVQDFTKRRGESNGLLFLRFRKWLSDLVATARPDVIAYERAHFRGGAATEICVGLQTRVQEIGTATEIETAPVTTAEVKKAATGKGRADKAQMQRAAAPLLRREWKDVDDNEADAVFVARWATEQYAIEEVSV